MSLISDGEIELYGYRFRVSVQPVQEELVSVFPGKIVIGDSRRVDDPIGSTYVMQDWIDGGLKRWMDPAVDINRFYYSNCMTWFNRQLTLPSLTRLVSPPVWSDAKSKQVRAGAEMGGIQYIGWDDRLSKLDVNEVVVEVSTGVGGSNQIADMLSYRIYAGVNAGVETLVIRWITPGSSTTGYSFSDGTTITAGVAGGCQALGIWDSKLIRVDDTNQVQYTLDLISWTNMPGQAIVPLPNGQVTGILIQPDFNGEDSLLIVTTSGMFFYDEVAQQVRRTRYKLPRLANQGAGSVVHRDMLYYSHPGLAITRYFNGTVSEEGLDRDDSLTTALRGNVTKLATSLNFLLAAVSASQLNASASPIYGGDEISYATTMLGTSGLSSIYGQAHTGGGWHNLFTSDVLGSGCLWVGVSSADNKFRLMFGNNGLLCIQDQFPDIFNPIDNTAQQFAITGQHVTSWNEAGWSEIPKLMLRQEFGVKGPGLESAGVNCTTAVRPACNIVVEYGLDYDETNWFPLTTLTSNVIASTYFGQLSPGVYLGTKAQRAFRYRYTLNRCDNISHTPVLVFSALVFLKEMASRFGYRFQLDLTAEVQGRTPSAQADILRRLADPSDLGANLGVLKFMVDGLWKVRNVKVSELTGLLSEGTQQRGMYNLAVVSF